MWFVSGSLRRDQPLQAPSADPSGPFFAYMRSALVAIDVVPLPAAPAPPAAGLLLPPLPPTPPPSLPGLPAMPARVFVGAATPSLALASVDATLGAAPARPLTPSSFEVTTVILALPPLPAGAGVVFTCPATLNGDPSASTPPPPGASIAPPPPPPAGLKMFPKCRAREFRVLSVNQKVQISGPEILLLLYPPANMHQSEMMVRRPHPRPPTTRHLPPLPTRSSKEDDQWM